MNKLMLTIALAVVSTAAAQTAKIAAKSGPAKKAAVPVKAAAVVGVKSTDKEQLAPEARLDACEPAFSRGQLLPLSIVNPVEMAGF